MYLIIQERYAKLCVSFRNYGVKTADGIILEADSNHYISQNPSYLLPNIESNDITSNLSSGSRYILMPLAQGIKTVDNYRDTLKIQKYFNHI